MSGRLSFTPRHEGDLILPCNLIFNRLLVFAHRPNCIAIRDVNSGVEKTFAEFLSDVLHLRNLMRSRLSPDIIQRIRKEDEVYITLLAPGGYEFAVGAFAILALGAAISPISVAQPVEEAAYYVNKARSVAVLTSASASHQGQALTNSINTSSNSTFLHIEISSVIQCHLIDPSQIVISSNIVTSPDQPSLLIFTSGTTGPPKGAVLRHATISDTALIQASRLDLQQGDTVLHLLPVHHATGIWVSFFPFILSGSTIEFKSGSFDPAWTWNRFKRGQGLTHFSGVPTIYMRMMRYHREHISRLPPHEQSSYSDAVKNLKVMMCGTSALPEPIDKFWSGLLGNDRRIIQRYGSTELCVVFDTPLSPEDNREMPDGSVGKLFPGVDIKLRPIVDSSTTATSSTAQGFNSSIGSRSKTDNNNDDDTQKEDKENGEEGEEEEEEEEEGEILVRSPHMFSKYLHDPLATSQSHEPQTGYFLSGDLARRKGPYYSIIGRANIDMIKSGGYKISALDVERAILSLPYISEVMVVGVPDEEEYGQRVGAVVVLGHRDHNHHPNHNNNDNDLTRRSLSINDLRNDIRQRLAGYKLPTVLRVLHGGKGEEEEEKVEDNERELPKSATGKVVKKILGPKYFPPGEWRVDVNVQVWDKDGVGGQSSHRRHGHKMAKL